MTKPGLIQKLLSKFKPAASPESIARQLRKPSGKFGQVVSNKMNTSNRFLYDFVFDCMEIKDNEAILEIGFGNGMFFENLFSRADNLSVSGIDYSSTMLKAAKKNNESAIDKGVLDLRFGDCDVLPFDSNSFDKVFCINVVYFWENPADNLFEIHRVLKPGGKFYTGIRHKDSMINLPFTQYGFRIYDEESWKNQLKRNLFNFLEIKTIEEPEIEFNGQYYTPKSLCIVAQKPHLNPPG